MTPPESAEGPLVSTTANPDRKAASVDYSGLATHPVVAAILAVTPTRFDGVCALDDCALASSDANAHEIAAKQAAAVLRWLADYWDTHDGYPAWHIPDLADLADEVEAAGTDNTTRSATP